MKIKGKVAGAFVDYVAIPRGDGRIVFKLTPPTDLNLYDIQWPAPKPPMRQFPNKATAPYPDDPNYKKELAQWIGRKYDWLYVNTLRETEDLVWERVKLDDILTYQYWTEELQEFGLSTVEMNYLLGKINEVNGLSDAKLKEAREAFLLEMEAQSSPSLPPEDLSST